MDGGTYGTSTTRYNQPFNPMDGLATFTERTTSILNEGGDNNYIQFVIWTKGVAKRFWNTKRRKQRLYVFKVDLNELINTSTSPATGVSYQILHENQWNAAHPTSADSGGNIKYDLVMSYWKEDGFLPNESYIYKKSISPWVETETVPVYQSVDYSKLVTLLTGALQEAVARIETLETKVSTLEGG